MHICTGVKVNPTSLELSFIDPQYSTCSVTFKMHQIHLRSSHSLESAGTSGARRAARRTFVPGATDLRSATGTLNLVHYKHHRTPLVDRHQELYSI